MVEVRWTIARFTRWDFDGHIDVMHNLNILLNCKLLLDG